MFGDLGKIMQVVGTLKKKLPEMKEQLALAEFTADAGGGVVSATVNGKLAMVDLKISPAALADENINADMLADLIRAAVMSAQDQAGDAAKKAMAELTGDMGLPGLDEMLA